MSRVGFGYDIHRFGKGRPLVLGGVRIPHSQGLVGHSDADVLIHAICDALLGAAAMGDIGRHFPNTDPKYKDISSLKLLAAVERLLKKKGYRIFNIDSTVVLETPRITPFIEAMQVNIAKILSLDPQEISIKATTHEGLGAIGSGMGCAAYCIVSLIPET
jgi:2-C-methyl-D-erythritol 2,4-cyclodiphosphate synthase